MEEIALYQETVTITRLTSERPHLTHSLKGLSSIDLISLCHSSSFEDGYLMPIWLKISSPGNLESGREKIDKVLKTGLELHRFFSQGSLDVFHTKAHTWVEKLVCRKKWKEIQTNRWRWETMWHKSCCPTNFDIFYVFIFPAIIFLYSLQLCSLYSSPIL